ncbi:TPA: restriction endonuclease subunit S [Campylobacter jejuni]|uniref:Putative type I specificity subunit HsdS n=1 Tax=Campylobacter jejuni TaxID=197 RepID=Q8GN11_CAMJU|nr:restriction endonuclease subunit S [Campylobacter jejuni]AAN33162.1 putative type I specificity subunit HsdS [Campylobacter jejuni]EAH8179797.1 restriction endonuclease subunit S [Campylobacter jejuni]EAI2655428.1 restriction endonuclease subunit S [Campylobacter jejuni]EAI5615699.1 restriction endonuclease subunit S [Campylobacter jejuni]EAI9708525.1 restriction endonuclease subunit S [Campylobacter jejuni]
MTNLPQGWKMETLGEILSSDKYSIKRGPFGSALKKSFFVEKGIRIFEQYNPINNDPHWKRYFISHEKFQELEAFKATEGDLLISCSGTLGKIVELPKDTEMGIINQALLKIRLNNIKILNSYFIYYFNSPIMQEKILESTLGSAIKNIASVKILKQIEIPLPPLKKQERIVGILDESFAKIDESIKILEQNLLNLDELMQSALQKAFNPLKDNAKENYKLPQSWEWKSLEEISENISAGGDKPKNCTESKTAKNQIPVYANGVNNNGLVGYTDKATIIKPSLTISARGTIGFVCIRKEPYFPIVRLISLIPCENILCLHYLYFCLNFFIAKGEGSSIPQLTIPKFKSLQIPLPPLKEQEQIAKHLDFIFEKTKALKELYTKELKDYEELKQSLLNKAFKGEL